MTLSGSRLWPVTHSIDHVPEGSIDQGLERLVFFSDAVFAIVITLLVLPLTAEVDLSGKSEPLVHQVWGQWPRMLSFAVSFLVIGRFWIAHHSMYGFVRRFDQGLLWLNLVTLLTVSFLPFPTAVLGARLESDDQFPVVFYATSMAVCSAALTLSWIYACRRGLVTASLTGPARALVTGRAVATTMVFLLSVGPAVAGLVPAACCWLLAVPAARLVVRRVLPRSEPNPAD